MLLSSHIQFDISFAEIAYAYLHVHGVHVTTKLHTYTYTYIGTPGECLWLPAAIPSFRLTSKHLREFAHVSPHKESIDLMDLSIFILEIRAQKEKSNLLDLFSII